MDHDHRIKDFHANFSIITCSSTRTKENDDSGRSIVEAVTKAGHIVLNYHVINDDLNVIRKTVEMLIERSDAIIITGGTGITSRDVTIEAVSSIAEYEMTGFSSVFSIISFREIGTSAIMSRATAFIVKRKPVFCLPGSVSGALLAVESIILQQIDHIHHELQR